MSISEVVARPQSDAPQSILASRSVEISGQGSQYIPSGQTARFISEGVVGAGSVGRMFRGMEVEP